MKHKLAISALFLASVATSCGSVAPRESAAPITESPRQPASESTVIPFIPVKDESLPVRSGLIYETQLTPPSSSTTGPRRKLTIVVIGDSLTAPSAARMRKFSDDRCEFIIDSDYGRTTDEATDVITGMRDKLSLKNPSDTHYVIALGTNDASQEDSYREKFSRVLKSIPESSRVYWVTTFRSAPLYAQFRAVSSLAASSGRVYILDWATQLLSNPSILKSDNTHLTEGGYRFRSDFIKIHTCDLSAP